MVTQVQGYPVRPLKTKNMFESAISINLFQFQLLTQIVDDLDESRLYEPAAGHGHTPAWILGHLAITGELGQQFLGGQVTHSNWLQMFGPGSKDDPALLMDDANKPFTTAALLAANTAAYNSLRDLAGQADCEDSMNKPHGLEIFADTPIQTVKDAVTLLLTNHFGFHLSQLSSIRRDAGHQPLF